MAGHSQYANIKHRKDAQDKKRSRLFTKLVREIIVAAGEGLPDPAFNPRLRSGLAAARKAGVPRDRLEYAIKKGSGEIAGEAFVELRYEGYAPAGIALIVEVATDNRNRSASEVRSTFTKNGGSMGETGSVNFMFERVGQISFPVSVATADAMFEAALEAGASNCESGPEKHEILCEPEQLHQVRDALVARFGEPEASGLGWNAKIPVAVSNAEDAKAVLELIELLEDLDDVQAVYSNIEIPEAVAKQL